MSVSRFLVPRPSQFAPLSEASFAAFNAQSPSKRRDRLARLPARSLAPQQSDISPCGYFANAQLDTDPNSRTQNGTESSVLRLVWGVTFGS